MRPVNLLPPKHRPHQPTGSKSGSSYLVVGILALFLGAVVTYVLETNKITQAESEAAVAEQRTAEARARTTQLGAFGNFAQIKEQRVASVRMLAGGRFDWERTVRELAHVLPDGVWLRDFDASVAPTGSGEGSTWPGPAIRLHGCAQKQPQVATMLVRLKQLQGVHDVRLVDSTRAVNGAAATGDSAADGDNCGVHAGRPNYEFNAVVEFEQAAPAPQPNAGKTPVRLGGGS